MFHDRAPRSDAGEAVLLSKKAIRGARMRQGEVVDVGRKDAEPFLLRLPLVMEATDKQMIAKEDNGVRRQQKSKMSV